MDRVRIDRELKALISAKLKQIRKDSDHSIEKMAAEIGLEYTAFYNIYNGRNLPRLLTLIQISQTYNIPLDFWFKDLGSAGKEEKETPLLSNPQHDILRVFAKLDDNTKNVVLNILKGYVRKPKYDIK